MRVRVCLFVLENDFNAFSRSLFTEIEVFIFMTHFLKYIFSSLNVGKLKKEKHKFKLRCVKNSENSGRRYVCNVVK